MFGRFGFIPVRPVLLLQCSFQGLLAAGSSPAAFFFVEFFTSFNSFAYYCAMEYTDDNSSLTPDDFPPAFEPVVVRVPLPPDFKDETDRDIAARASAICGAAEEIVKSMLESGQNPEDAITPEDREMAQAAFGIGPQSISSEPVKTGTAMMLTALLNKYDMQVVHNAQQIRNLCTNILLEKAVKGKSDAAQLRAVEMLGKIKDVGLFEERSTVLVENMPTDDLKVKLRQKINQLRHLATDAIDITPQTKDQATAELLDPDSEE